MLRAPFGSITQQLLILNEIWIILTFKCLFQVTNSNQPSKIYVFWWNVAVEVIEATEVVEAVEVIKAAEVPDTREITKYVKCKVPFSVKMHIKAKNIENRNWK